MFELTLSYKKDQNKTKKAIDSFQEFIEKYTETKKDYLTAARLLNNKTKQTCHIISKLTQHNIAKLLSRLVTFKKRKIISKYRL